MVISHKPIPKHRVIVPLAEPFVIAKEGRTAKEAQDKWAKVPQALADRLGVGIDKVCLDVSRLFYLPRHPKGGKHETSVFGGQLLDWRDLDIEDVWGEEAKNLGRGQSKSTTDEGRALGRWSVQRAHGFQIAQAVEDLASEKVRGSASSGITCECPFDEDHSNPGDPDDVAFCCNAGDGPSELFVAHCRHDSCRERTNLDFLGKLIADGWFGDTDVLTDEDYNNAEIDDAEEVEAFVESLSKESSAADKEKAFKLLAAAEAKGTLSLIKRDEILEKINSKARVKAPAQKYKFAQQTLEPSTSSTGASAGSRAAFAKLQAELGRPYDIQSLGRTDLDLDLRHGEPWLVRRSKREVEFLCTPVEVLASAQMVDNRGDRVLHLRLRTASGWRDLTFPPPSWLQAKGFWSGSWGPGWRYSGPEGRLSTG